MKMNITVVRRKKEEKIAKKDKNSFNDSVEGVIPLLPTILKHTGHNNQSNDRLLKKFRCIYTVIDAKEYKHNAELPPDQHLTNTGQLVTIHPSTCMHSK